MSSAASQPSTTPSPSPQHLPERLTAATVVDATLAADAFAAAAGAMVLIDAGTRAILAANPAFHALAAPFPDESLVGRAFADLPLLRSHPEHCTAVFTLTPGAKLAGLTLERRAPNGAPESLELTAACFVSGGRPVLHCSLRDVTSDRIRERRLRQTEKMEALSLLAGSAGHDFNNVLSCVRGYVSIALETPGAPEELRQILVHVQDASVRAGKLPQRLLGFSRQQKLQLQTIELQSWIAALAPEFRAMMPAGIAFETVPGGAPLPVSADAGLLRQALLLLVTNAREAITDRGCITVSATRWDVPAAEPRGSHAGLPEPVARLSVHDGGRGMSAATQARLFEPGFTTKKSGGGAGASLSMVYRITALHGGWIDVESEEGHGSVFTLVLPLATGGRQP